MEAYVKKQVSIRIMTAFVLIRDLKEGSVMVSNQMRTHSESFSIQAIQRIRQYIPTVEL